MTDNLRIGEAAFLVLSEDDIGCNGFHHAVETHLYDPAVTRIPDTGGPVPDRWRSKGMVMYERHGANVHFVNTTAHRIGVPPAAREVAPLDWLAVPGAHYFTQRLLNLVPVNSTHDRGTFGVHAFRSFTNVVDNPHKDGFEWGITYVADLDATAGGESYLTTNAGTEVLRRQLQPGEFVIYEDAKFWHGATPIAGGHRDALVIQIDAPEDHASALELGLL
jgi:2OG-Fe dioxygenase